MADPQLGDHLADLGASVAQMVDLGDADLIGLAGDLQFASGLELDVVESSRQAGCDQDEIRSTYEVLRLRVEELAGFGDGDVAMMSLVVGDTSGVVGSRLSGSHERRQWSAC